MTKSLTTLASLFTLVLVLTGSAQAGSPFGNKFTPKNTGIVVQKQVFPHRPVVQHRPFPQVGGFHKPVVIQQPYHLAHGRSFSHGYFFPGQHHNHWTKTVYSSQYGCNLHWCPSTDAYYYWNRSAAAYYPLSYLQRR